MFRVNRNRQEILTQAAQTHRSNLQKRLQHRLEVARAKGDDTLVRLLEAEVQYLG